MTEYSGMHQLPSGPIEVFYITPTLFEDEVEPGWYWWSCHPGCLPDGEAIGPFASPQDAFEDACDETAFEIGG